MPVPPVISTVPDAHASGIVMTTLPMWRAWLRCRSAAGARRTSQVLTGSGFSTPVRLNAATPERISAMPSAPASKRSNAR